MASPGPALVAAFAAQEESPGYRKQLEYVASLTALDVGHHEYHHWFCQLYCSVFWLQAIYLHFRPQLGVVADWGLPCIISALLHCILPGQSTKAPQPQICFVSSSAVCCQSDSLQNLAAGKETSGQFAPRKCQQAPPPLSHAQLSACMVSPVCVSSFV